jgi:hypothetical protein
MSRYSLKQGVRLAAHVSFLVFLTSIAPVNATPSAAVALAWDPSSDTTVVGYNVYYGIASGSYTNIITVGAATTTTVSNLANGVTYYFAATTYAADGVESVFSAEASYAVPGLPVNIPPTLDAIPNLAINEDAAEQTVGLTGISSGSANEAQTLTVSAFSSNPTLIPNPLVIYTSPGTSGTLTFMPAPGSYGNCAITVMVDDGGTISNTVIRTFNINVSPVNNPPTIDLIHDVVVNGNAAPQTIPLTGISSGSTNGNVTLLVSATSSNPSLIANPVVSYASPAATGTLTFAPATNISGVARISVVVADNQPTNNTTTLSFQITVNQVAPAPGLLASASVAPNSIFRFLVPLPATNGDKFAMSLGAAPSGVKLSSRKGISWLVWTPTMAQASTTNNIGIKITDSNNSALSTNETVQVIVEDYLALAIGTTTVQAGQSGSVPISLSSSEGVTNLSFTVPWPTNALGSPTLSISAAGVASSALGNQGTNLLVTLKMSAGQVLQNSNVIGTLGFQSSAVQSSGYINLSIATLSAYKPSTAAYLDSYPLAGRVAIVNNLAMIQANTTTNTTRSLTVLAKIGNTYQVQYATNFGPSTVWLPLMTYSQTNISQTISVDPSIAPAFYRVQQK